MLNQSDGNESSDATNATFLQPKKGLIFGGPRPSLTLAEKDVLRLLTIEFLSPIQIAYIRKCSHQAVYKVIRHLRKKGFLTNANTGVANEECSLQPMQPFTTGQENKESPIRLHGQEWNIRILYKDERYVLSRKRGDTFKLDDNTVRLHEDTIEVYSGKSFAAKDEHEAERKSLEYWYAFFIRLENQLKVTIFKERAQNFRMVKVGHYARANSDVYKSTVEHEGKIKVYCPIDGKLAFVTDDSFGLGEDETLHPKTAKIDRGNIDKHINDWRLNNPLTNTEITQMIKHLAAENALTAENLKETSAGLLSLAEFMKSQIPQKREPQPGPSISGRHNDDYIG